VAAAGRHRPGTDRPGRGDVRTLTPTGFFYDAGCLRHDTGPGHPERPDRIRAVREHLVKAGLVDPADGPAVPGAGRAPAPPIREWRPAPCDPDHLVRVHPAPYVAAIETACRRAPARLDPDTAVSPGSWEATLLAAGAAIDACEAVASGRLQNAFVCARPPGHHAETDRAMGFCLFNNVAVAARYLQTQRGLGRIFIVDWDVHHGNGTQQIFEADDSVFYFSTHQYPFYPGTGGRNERGAGRGEGFTLNVPLPAGTGDAEYLRIFREILRPAIDRFDPEMILVSAGFDAHRDDPLASMAVTEAGFASLTRIVREVAGEHCGGRIVSLLEGGYNLGALARSVEAHLRVLGVAPDKSPMAPGSTAR
jgi:acetoin utilization deacetylase AcuC-like enzyme